MPARYTGILLRRHGAGWGCRQKCTGIPHEGAGGVGGAGEVSEYPCEGAGGVGDTEEEYEAICRESAWRGCQGALPLPTADNQA